MKKHTFKKKNTLSFKEKNLWAIIALLVIAQIISFTYLLKIHKSLNDQSKVIFSRLISSTEEDRYKYPVIDISGERVYIPEARVYLPLNDTTRNVRYDFRNDKNNATLYFSLPVAIGHQLDVDDPSCDRMVALSQEKQPSIVGDLVGEVDATKNGMKYISRHASCRIYPDSSSEALAEMVKQIQSY